MKEYIGTSRLILRDWKESDLPVFEEMNGDDRVMEYFLKKLTQEETLEFYRRIRAELAEYGYGLYAVECREDGAFIGYVGFHHLSFELAFAPKIEIGWRLMPQAWGKGYATEAASACLEHAKAVLNMKEVCAFTSLPNKHSERVMQKIGMQKICQFSHPLVDPRHPLCEHVLYKAQL